MSRRKLSPYVRDLRVRVTDDVDNYIGWALNNPGLTKMTSVTQLVNDALAEHAKKYEGQITKAHEKLSEEVEVKHKKIDKLAEVVEKGFQVPVAPVVEKVIVESPSLDLDLTRVFPGLRADRQRSGILAWCRETNDKEKRAWASRCLEELEAVEWDVETFLLAKENWDKEHAVVERVVLTPRIEQPETSPTLQRISSLVKRLLNIAHGSKDQAYFDAEFRLLRELQLNEEKLELLRATVVKQVRSKMMSEISGTADPTLKKKKQGDLDIALTVFEDAWFREFETSEEEKQRLVN